MVSLWISGTGNGLAQNGFAFGFNSKCTNSPSHCPSLPSNRLSCFWSNLSKASLFGRCSGGGNSLEPCLVNQLSHILLLTDHTPSSRLLWLQLVWLLHGIWRVFFGVATFPVWRWHFSNATPGRAAYCPTSSMHNMALITRSWRCGPCPLFFLNHSTCLCTGLWPQISRD